MAGERAAKQPQINRKKPYQINRQAFLAWPVADSSTDRAALAAATICPSDPLFIWKSESVIGTGPDR
jgi:hypothetical protein